MLLEIVDDFREELDEQLGCNIKNKMDILLSPTALHVARCAALYDDLQLTVRQWKLLSTILPNAFVSY